MKYIRTKDGIVEITKVLSYCYLDKSGNEYLLDKYKTADTIEELCDEFVLTDNGNPPLIIHNVVELDSGIFENVKTLKTQYKVIYGAIWTDKGLIYVAKMNENGEFELL